MSYSDTLEALEDVRLEANRELDRYEDRAGVQFR